jgi:CBS domain
MIARVTSEFDRFACVHGRHSAGRFDGKTCPGSRPSEGFFRSDVRARFCAAHFVPTERCIDLIVVLSARSLRAGTQSGSSEMTVKAILASKGTDVTTIEPTATVEYGIGILAERGIGALVVLGADHRVIGLLSERDIVRARGGTCPRSFGP